MGNAKLDAFGGKWVQAGTTLTQESPSRSLLILFNFQVDGGILADQFGDLQTIGVGTKS